MIVIDTCTLINLINSGCLNHVCNLKDLDLCIGDIVLGECETIKDTLDALQEQKIIRKINDDEVPIDVFSKLVTELNLGQGEAECIAIGDHLGCAICTDDGKARKYVAATYGAPRLVGSIGLIKKCYIQGLKTKEQAYKGYTKMKSNGAFLPLYAEPEFVNLLNAKPSEHA